MAETHDEINPWEQLQDVLRKTQNRRVREHFRDLGPVDGDWTPNISTPRGALFYACTMLDNDTSTMTVLRMFLFWMVLGQATALHPPLYTLPSDRYQQSVKFAPQITLYFKEDSDDVEDGYAPIDAEVSFRLMDEDNRTLSQTDLNTVANRIRLEFALSNGYRWRKGRVKLNYRDPERGYLMSVNAFSESEGKDLIRKVLDIQNHTLDGDKLTIQQLDSAPPIVPPQQVILGKTRRLPRKRPVGYVRFIYADLHIWGIPKAICLLDRSGRRRDPVIRL
jgi:hypothetical protein